MQTFPTRGVRVLCLAALAFAMATNASPSHAAAMLVVDDDGPADPGPGDATVSDPLEDGSAAHPFDSIQEAIDAAADGDTVSVEPGTYFESIDLLGKQITLTSSGGQGVTTIDAAGLGARVVGCTSGEDRDTLVEGFTITGGDAFSGGGMFNLLSSPTVRDCTFIDNIACVGGGMLNDSGSPLVVGCTFEDNRADADGGGMYNFSTGALVSSPVVNACVFRANLAGGDGGGMWTSTNTEQISTPVITDCLFVENRSGDDGGGMWNATSLSTIVGCSFLGNIADQDGGGLWMQNTDLTILNCQFSGNIAFDSGGAMNTETSSPKITNCAFANNIGNFDADAFGHGGGLFNSDGAPGVANCIFWGNTPAGEQIFESFGDASIVSFCDVMGGWPGLGNIDCDPLWSDPFGGDGVAGTEDDDLRLTAASACVDGGNNNAVPIDVLDLDADLDTSERTPLDLDGNPRFADGVPAPSGPCLLGAGCGAPVIVDQGPYERSGPSVDPIVVADLDGDGVVGFSDLILLLFEWGPCAGCCVADVDFNGTVDFEDLLLLLALYQF